MFFERIESKGLAHYSYLVGDGGKAFVIDPMRDVQPYLDIARDNDLVITDIFETHRNEDYISGSMELAEKSGARIHISSHEDLGYEYGMGIEDGDEFAFGDLKLQALHTPGHTRGHMSYVLYESGREEAYMVFTGDCLFMGDLGRTDFYGKDKLDEMTGLMYDSIFNKLFPLGDEVFVMPAHGAGSACGESAEDRPFTSIGYERLHNPDLQVESKEEFIESFGKMRIKPDYFEKMEVCNVKGAEFIGSEPKLKALDLDQIDEEDVIIDIRPGLAYIASHIPGSTYIGPGNLANLLGNLHDTEASIVFVGDDMDILEEAYWDARRTGFDRVKGYLRGGMSSYLATGEEFEKLETISADDFTNLEDPLVLDVRGVEYLDEIGRDGNVYKIPVQLVNDYYEELEKDEPIYVICGSGERATTAASYLKGKGYDARVILGGAQAL